MDIKQELGKIGVRGGHGVGDNVIPKPFDKMYPKYSEGTFVHGLSQDMSDEFGFSNLEPETSKLKWSTIAKRGAQTDCDTIIYNHTNWSVGSKSGNPNSGIALIIYPFENECYKPMYEKMAEIFARHMGFSKWETRIRMSTRYKNKNYYSAIHYGMRYGIKHPLIVEYGYHIDIAGKEDERKEQIIGAWREIIGIDDSIITSTEDEKIDKETCIMYLNQVLNWVDNNN